MKKLLIILALIPNFAFATSLGIGTNTFYSKINDPDLRFAKEYENIKDPINAIRNVNVSLTNNYGRFIYSIATNRLFNSGSNRLVLDNKGREYQYRSQLIVDSASLSYAITKDMAVGGFLGNLYLNQKVSRGSYYKKTEESALVYGATISKRISHLCGIDVPIPSSEIMLYEKTRKSFDNMWDRVKTFWEMTPNEECGVAYIEKNDENSNSFILRGFYEAETVFDPVLHRFGQAVGVKWHGATEIGNIFKAIGFIAEQCENNNPSTTEFIGYVKSNSRLVIKNEVVKNNSNDLKDHLDIIIDSLQMTETAKDKTIELAKQILSENEFEKCFMADNEKVLLYRFSSLIREFVNSVRKKSENNNLSNQ